MRTTALQPVRYGDNTTHKSTWNTENPVKRSAHVTYTWDFPEVPTSGHCVDFPPGSHGKYLTQAFPPRPGNVAKQPKM